MLKKMGACIICAVMACSILAGCGGTTKKADPEEALQALVNKDGATVTVGGKDMHILNLDTPPDIKRMDGESAGMVWLNGSIYGITMANDRDLVKLTIKDKKIEAAKDALRLDRNSYMDGTDGTQIYYKNERRHHILKDGKDGGVIYDKEAGRFTPFPGGTEGFLWYDNAKVHQVKLENGKITDVDKDNWLQSNEMKSMYRIVIEGDAVFMAGWYDLNVKKEALLFEYDKRGNLIRKFGDGEAGQPGVVDHNINAFAVTKAYVVLADDSKDLKVYDRKDGKFIGVIKAEDLKFPGHPDCLVQLADNLILAHGFSGTGMFTLISL